MIGRLYTSFEDPGDAARKSNSYHFDRHASGYRGRFAEVTKELHSRCPVAWSDTYDGHWVVSGYQEVFDIARRADILSNDHDPKASAAATKAIMGMARARPSLRTDMAVSFRGKVPHGSTQVGP